MCLVKYSVVQCNGLVEFSGVCFDFEIIEIKSLHTLDDLFTKILVAQLIFDQYIILFILVLYLIDNSYSYEYIIIFIVFFIFQLLSTFSKKSQERKKETRYTVS